MKFEAERINYYSRLRREFLFVFLIVTAILLFSHFRNPAISWGITAGMIVVVAFGLGISAHWNARKNIHKAEIDGETIRLSGDAVNKPFEIQLPIAKTVIEIKSKGRGRGNVEYYLRFSHGSGKYDVNRLFNWDYARLLELFYAFKEAKGEKVIFDEKYFLEIMAKKAKGMSNIEIVFGEKE